MKSFARALALSLLAMSSTAARPVLLRLEGMPDLTGPELPSNQVVVLLQEAHQAAYARLVPSLTALGVAEDAVEHLWIVNGVIAEVGQADVASLAELPGVVAVSENRDVPMLPFRADHDRLAPEGAITWSVEKIGAPKVWSEFGVDGTGVVIGHIDTGADGTHPDLKGKTIAFRDFLDSSNHAVKDGEGHGTHTAGTVLGGDKGGTAVGVAPGARMIVARVLDEKGANTFRLLRSMQWMMDPDGDNGTDDAPDIGSNSWGSILGVDPSFWLSVNAWRKAGIIPVFAAGNEGPDPKSTGIPGGYPHSYAVGATTRRDEVAYFSSRGPVRWGFSTYVKPDVSAPGDGIYSSRDGGGYTYLSGTSMATPCVAGALALLKQYRPGLSVDRAEQILAATATDKGPAGKDNDYGAGILDVYRAVKRLAAEDPQ